MSPQFGSAPTGPQAHNGQPPTSPSASVKRKRSQVSQVEEELHPSKLPRQLFTPELPESLQRPHEAVVNKQELTPSTYQLSEANLCLFNQEIDAASSTTRTGSVKRSSSQRSLSSQATKPASNTNGRYRFDVLQPAQLNFHVDPPQHVLDAIRAIVNAEPPAGRRDELEQITQRFQSRCKETVQSTAAEVDFVNIFNDVLELMNPGKLRLRGNADWDDRVKPRIQYSGHNVAAIFSLAESVARSQSQETGDTLIPPLAKRQQQAAGRPRVAAQSSTVDEPSPPPVIVPQETARMPLPVTVPGREGATKTPRPDITIGIQKSALASALSWENMNEKRALLFLSELQRVMESTDSGEPGEPILISVPSPLASDLAMPFAVVEGKAYLTGQQLSAAENQAAVSGACALRIQLRLDELLKGKQAESAQDQLSTSSGGLPASSKRSFPSLPPPPEDQVPLFFSISTEGPVHVLWAHWTEIKYDEREYNMMPWKCVYGSLLDGLLEFFIMVDNILRWGTGHFLECLAARLQTLARRTRVP